MKKTIIILILCTLHCAFCQKLNAQYPEYAVGIRGGTTWSLVSFNPSIAQSSLPLTYHGGVQFRMVSEKFFGIKLELNYAQRGFNDKDGHRQFDYIGLPFMSHITFGQKLFRFFIDLGPEISYLIKDYPIIVKGTSSFKSLKQRLKRDLAKPKNKKFNFSFKFAR